MFRYLSLALTSGMVAVSMVASSVSGNHPEKKGEILRTVNEEEAVRSVVRAHFEALREGKAQKLSALWDTHNGVYASAMLDKKVLSTTKASDWIAASAAAANPHLNEQSLKMSSFKLLSPGEATVQVSYTMNGQRPLNTMTFTLKKMGSAWRIVKLVDQYLYFGC